VTGVVSGQIKLSALPFRPKIQRPCHSSFEAALRHQTAAAISWLAMTFRWPADLPQRTPHYVTVLGVVCPSRSSALRLRGGRTKTWTSPLANLRVLKRDGKASSRFCLCCLIYRVVHDGKWQFEIEACFVARPR